MLYYLFTYLDKVYDFPGAGLFNYISFRAAMSALFSLLIILIFGKPFINFLKKETDRRRNPTFRIARRR